MDPGAASDFGQSTGYVYVVAPDQKMVNVPETLGEFLPSEFAKESELAAVGKIPFEQVRGWIKKSSALRPGDWIKLRDVGPKLSGEPLTDDLRQQLGKAMADAYTPNTKYDAAKYDKTRESGGRPELAGFPKDSKAWQDERWKPFQDKKVSESLKEFLSETVCAKEEACVAGQLTSKAGEAGVPDPYKDVDPPCKETDLKKREEGEGACVLPADAPDAEEGTEPSAGTEPEETENTEPAKKEPAEEGLGEIPETGLSESEKLDLARKTSNEVFEDLFTSHKLSEKAAEWGLKAQDTRNQLIGYKPLTGKSPHFKMSKAGLALEGAALVAWGSGLVTAFTSNATDWEKAAAATALVPFVGCGFNAIAESETREGMDVLDQMLCITADIMLFTPLSRFAFAVQVFRVIAQMFKTPLMPTVEEVQETRDKAWSTILDDEVYTYYYSDDSLSSNRKLRDKLNAPLYADKTAIVSDAADFIAAANATMEASAQGHNVDKEQIRAVVLDVSDQIKTGISSKVAVRQREFLLQLPQRIKEETDLSVQKMAEQFNKETMAQITSNEMVEKYTPSVPTVEGDPGVNLERQVRGELGVLATHLKKTPLPLPKLFDVAYVLGQSKALLDIDPQTLNPGAFIKSRAPDMSQDDIDFYALHHALQISMVLRGNTTEEKLSKLWPSDGGDETVQELQLLLALKFGRTFDSQKMAAAAQLAENSATPQEAKFMTHPSIPPLKVESESMAYMGLILELSEERITALPRSEDTIGFKDLGTDEKLVMAMLEKAMELFVERQNDNNSTLPKEGQAAAAA